MMMTEPEEECELQQLVPSDEDHRSGEQYEQITPPVSPSVSKIAHTSQTSQATNKVSSNSPGGTANSNRGGVSQDSSSPRSLSRIANAPSIGANTISNSGSSNQGTRLLFVNERSSVRHPRLSLASLTSRPNSIKRDVTDVRRMETALLHLLEDFHSGKLRAFGKDCSMEQMTGIREQQERLARLHFELGAQQELFPPLSSEGLDQGTTNMNALMTSLEQLSESIEKLHSFNS